MAAKKEHSRYALNVQERAHVRSLIKQSEARKEAVSANRTHVQHMLNLIGRGEIKERGMQFGLIERVFEYSGQEGALDEERRQLEGTQFTCFTGTKVRILTQQQQSRWTCPFARAR